jgi:glycosyltransferase involved in cell wall biosynthesis
MKATVLIPHYNHGEGLADVLAGLADQDLPCLVVDDGSDEQNRARVAWLAARWPWVEVVYATPNRGRGVALRIGYEVSWRRGFSHVVQLDADGQHAPADVPRFLAIVRRRPEALVLGVPTFDASAPWGRRYGRRLSTLWASIETLSRVIPDALCGFRAIPLRPAIDVIERRSLGDRMEFDPALVVHLVWRRVPVAPVAIHVRYRRDVPSHFRLWEDNIRIAAMHARLFLGMFLRLPDLVRHRPVMIPSVSAQQ